MKKIKIEKYCNDKLTDTSEIPIFLVSMIAKFLPMSAFIELEKQGIYLDKMIELSQSDEDSVSEINVIENGIAKFIKISVIN